MIIPIGHEETSVRRLPWVTFAIMAVCVAVQLASPEDPTSFYQTWGLVPTDLSPLTAVSHVFMHGGWGHLIGNLIMLFLVGPPIEDRWGRPLFFCFYMAAGIFSGLFFSALSLGASTPLVGASGAIAGAMGACLVRLGRSKIQFYYFFFALRIIQGRFWAPAWAMLPLWFASELLSALVWQSAGVSSGIAYWAHVGGFAFGAAFALGVRQWKVEERFIHASIEGKITLSTHPAIDEAMHARATGDADGAFMLLREAVANHPDDPDLTSAFWEIACELGRPYDVAPALQQLVRATLAAGEEEQAARYWLELLERAADSRAEASVLVRLVPILERMENRHAVEQALAHAVDERQPSLTTGLALRVMDLAAEVAPSVALCAARRALESRELHLGKRARIEAFARQLETSGVSVESSRGTPTPDRRIAIDPPEDAIAAQSAAGVARWHGAKVIEAVPVEFGDLAITLQQASGERGRVDLDGIDAISVAAVGGLAAKPVLIVDLIANWTELSEGPLRLLRLRSDRFAVAQLFPEAQGSIAAFRVMLDHLLYHSAAVQLPDPESARGRPFRTYPDLQTYQREVLQVAEL